MQEGEVYASVMSSEGNEGFYLRSGFDEIVGWATEGEENPLRDVRGGAILFKWPRDEGGEGCEGLREYIAEWSKFRDAGSRLTVG